MSVKCSLCGRFSIVVDSYTPFGHYGQDEPPDDVLLCQKCVDKELEMYRKWNMMPTHWIRADYEEILAKELGYEWYVEGNNAWGRWKRKGE